MAKFVTPRGVVVETTEKAARAVGYKPAAEPEKKAPAKKAASSKKKSD